MITLGWYVLATSSCGKSVGTLGPYVTRAIADQRARDAGLVSYRVARAAAEAPGASYHTPAEGRASGPPFRKEVHPS